jgi:2-iminoacetate synthase ThiH
VKGAGRIPVERDTLYNPVIEAELNKPAPSTLPVLG